MEDIKNIIAKNLIELRRRSGRTQTELASELNYTDKAVSKWERGESLPDVTVLTELAKLYGVSLDYLVKSEHPEGSSPPDARVRRNRMLICALSCLMVWFAATFAFAVLDMMPGEGPFWLAFVYAVPLTMTVWLIFNCLWFDKRRNFLIISLLLWSILAAVYLTLLPRGNYWQVFIIGIPGQLAVILWSRLKKAD